MKRIIKVLQYTPEKYQMWSETHFLMWADRQAKGDPLHLQNILSNQKIRSYFYRQLSRREREFLNALQDREGVKTEIRDKRILYFKYVMDMDKYPKALIDKTRPEKVISIPSKNIIQSN